MTGMTGPAIERGKNTMLKLDPRRTALVAIDLQKGVLAMPIAPHSPATVVANSSRLAEALGRSGGAVVRVHVGFSADGADRLKQEVDQPMAGGPLPPDWMDFVAEVAAWRGALEIVKRQWGAFHGTELDLQLRRRGLDTIELTGVATNIGVEQTAREAWQHGYSVVVAEDATSSSVGEAAHRFAVETILPRVSRVRSTEAILAALA
jgi:nicotinamidase-related amidase